MTQVDQMRSQQPMADTVIAAQQLSKKFGDDYAVQDLNFQIPRGVIIGFIGPSGCGKTTTLRLLTGVYTPTEGRAIVLGRNPKEFSPRMREKIAMMPQLFALYPDLSIQENLTFTASLYGVGWATRRKRLKELLEFVELTEHRNKLARNISGGMQRRLSLAATLVSNPEILFLDEPTAGIDPILRNKFWEHFRQLREQRRTMFITTQYVGEAAYCDFIGVMAAGRLLMMETPEGLRRRAYGGDVIDIAPTRPLSWEQVAQIQQLPYVLGRVNFLPDRSLRVTVQNASTDLPELLEWSRAQNVEIESAKEYIPPYDDVFVSLVQREVNND